MLLYHHQQWQKYGGKPYGMAEHDDGHRSMMKIVTVNMAVLTLMDSILLKKVQHIMFLSVFAGVNSSISSCG